MIVSVEELRDYMSEITLTRAQLDAAEDVIAGVQSEVETFLNRPIETGVFTETVTTDGSGRAFLSNTPVASVQSVASADGQLAMFWNLEDGGASISAGVGAFTPVTITYTAGLNGLDLKILKLTVLRVAAREIQNKHDDTLSVKDLGTNDVSPLPEGLQDQDRQRINRFRRRVVA